MKARPKAALAVAAVFAAVAWLRSDLLLRYLHDMRAQAASGGWPAFQAIFENLLLLGMLGLGVLIIPRRASPARDSGIFFLALAAGYVVEAWGTRSGFWAYYTGETPPLWVLPGWALGALVIDRLSLSARRAWGERISSAFCSGALAGYAAVFFGVCGAFTGGRGLGLAAAMAGAMILLARPQDDFWILAAGIPCAFLADLWGMTNSCWTYRTQARPGLWSPGGAIFGMLFDPVVVLLALKIFRYGKNNPLPSR